MYYDFHYKFKPTGLGALIVKKLNIHFANMFLNILTTESKKKIKFLEIGYGRGIFAKSLRSQDKKKLIDYYAIEANNSLSKEGEKEGFKVKTTKIPPLPKYKNFDCVYMSHVLEHFVNYEVVLDVLKGINEVLSPNGYFILFFPDYIDLKSDYFEDDYSHEYILTARRIEHLFQDTGFKILKMRTYRGCFSFPINILIYFFHIIIKFFAGILYRLTNNRFFFKMKITFGKNILVIAKKYKD